MSGRSRPRPIAVPPSDFVTSGSTLLDLALGGGWGRGRIINIVGDQSTGKTLLAVEAAINFAHLGATETVRYREAENAFDMRYAQQLGLPEEVMAPPTDEPFNTVEAFFGDVQGWIKKRDYPSLYILDSLDALSDEDELERPMDKGSYGAGKAKLMSQFFRRLTDPLARSNTTLMVISQTRDKIGVVFGEKKTRSGGRALDFFASQIVWLAQIEQIKRTVAKTTRNVGIVVRVDVRKNKMAPPRRQVELQVYYQYGVDDERSMVEWLGKTGIIEGSEKGRLTKDINECHAEADREGLAKINRELRKLTVEAWEAIEERIQPKLNKYG